MFGIDQILSFRFPRREIAVVGWCCLDDLTPVEEVWALCEGVRVPCLTEVPRPDVARFLGSSALEKRRLRVPNPVRRIRCPRDARRSRRER